jgi:Ca2+-binding RTX toxin-like protein
LASETDTAGNTGTTSLTFTLDTRAPVPTITNEVLSHGKVTLSGTTAEANDAISIYDGSTLLGITKTGSDGAWTFLTGNVSNAVHIYTVNATDLAGNIGHSSNEAILGSSKADTLVGTSGNDIIIGNGGNDTFTGGGGADVLTAGSGKDSFVFKAISDSTPASHDTIINFNHTYDTINFTNIAGINATNGTPMFQGQLTGSGNLTLNAHSIGYIEVGGNTEVLVNTTNGAETVTTLDTHAANMEIVLVGVHLGLTHADFHLI